MTDFSVKSQYSHAADENSGLILPGVLCKRSNEVPAFLAVFQLFEPLLRNPGDADRPEERLGK